MMQPYHRTVLRRFEVAVEDMAFKGAKHPDEHEEIELEYKRAKAALIRILNKVPDNRPKRADG